MIGAGSEGGDAADLPDPDVDPNPEVDEDWPSFDGDAGHARFVEDGYEFDGDDLEVAWTADGEPVSHGVSSSPSVAVADGTVYAAGSSRGTNPVGAYDVADGSLLWKNDDLDASDPSVVGDTVYVTGDELFALDVSDGSVRWRTEFDPEDPIETQTVAYGAVFVVVDGTLYALEADDGSIRWEIDSVTAETNSGEEEEFDFFDTTAAANGVVYAAVGDDWSGARLALEPESGDEVWRNEQFESGGDQIRATETAVLFDSLSYARPVTDAQTGDGLTIAPSEGVDVAIGNEVYVGGNHWAYSAGQLDSHETDRREQHTTHEAIWETDIRYSSVSSVISGDTVYAYFYGAEPPQDAEYDEELVAFDKYDGTVKWVLAESELPVGQICAISDETLYVAHDGELVALREQTGEEEGDDQPEEGDEEDESDDEHDDTDEGDEEQDEPEDGDDQQEGDDEGEDESDDEDECGCPSDETESDHPDEDQADDEGGSDGDDDDGGSGGDDDDGDAGNGDPGNEDTGNETDDDGDDTDAAGDGDDADTDGDGMPGFTTSAGIVGGAATLEWLRRQADADEPAE